MKTFLTAIAVTTALSAPAFAMSMGNIAGSEYSGEPVNSSVRSSARNPVTGLTPGGEASYGYGRVYVKKKKHPPVIVTRPVSPYTR